MKCFVPAVVFCLWACGNPALAQGSAESTASMAPQAVCLVTTRLPGSFREADIERAEWLPLEAAEARAQENPSLVKWFDYRQDPLVTEGTYGSAEELCEAHFD